MVDKSQLASLRVQELRDALKAKGLETGGKKEELVARLLQALNSEEASTAEGSKQQPGAEASLQVVQQTDAAGITDGAKHSKIQFTESAKTTVPPKPLVVIHPSKPAANNTSSEEKLKARANRFGVAFAPLEDDKLKKRAERFHLAHPGLDSEKAKKRAMRFGAFHPDLEKEKKQKRAARFGVFDEDLEAKKKKERAERFGTTTALPAASVKGIGAGVKTAVDFEALKKARAERFKTA